MTSITRKGSSMEIVAIPYDSEARVDQRFGHADKFKLYTIEDNTVTSTEIVEGLGHGHDARVAALKDRNVTCVICGGIGTPAADGLEQAGIELYTSINGDTDRVVEQWLKGALPHIITAHKHGGDGCCHN